MRPIGRIRASRHVGVHEHADRLFPRRDLLVDGVTSVALRTVIVIVLIHFDRRRRTSSRRWGIVAVGEHLVIEIVVHGRRGLPRGGRTAPSRLAATFATRFAATFASAFLRTTATAAATTAAPFAIVVRTRAASTGVSDPVFSRRWRRARRRSVEEIQVGIVVENVV
jgi:hypothetical protein